MNHFVTMKNFAKNGDVFDLWTVKYHSATLLQTPVRGAAIDAYLLWRSDADSLNHAVAEVIEKNTDEAARALRRGKLDDARTMTALNLALVTWLEEDSDESDV